RRRAPAGPAAAAAAALSARLFAGLLARMGGGSERRHRRPVPAGRARHLRLPHRLLLAGAGAGSAESRARLDGQMCFRAEGLAQARSRVPGVATWITARGKESLRSWRSLR